MGQLIYGNGGLAELPTAIEAALLQGAVGSSAKVETVDTHTSTAIDSISPVLTAADVGKVIFGAGIPTGTTIVAVAVGGASATLSAAATATATAVRTLVYPITGLAGAKVMLFTNNLNPPFKAKTVADLTEPIYDGYAKSSAVSWDQPFYDAAGNALVTGDKKQFYCTGPTASPSVKGAALVSPDGVTLLQVDVFVQSNGDPAPVTMTQAGNAFDYVPVVSLV